MSEALQQVEIKKERAKAKANSTKDNPTIAALEIMTRKELKAGEMEQRFARGEIPDVPIPATPEHFKRDENSLPKQSITQQNFLENISAQQPSKIKQVDLRRSESMRMEKPMLSPKPSFHKRLSQENVGATAPIILLKKQPKRLDPDEIKARQALERKSSQDAKIPAATAPSPLPEPKHSLKSQPEDDKTKPKPNPEPMLDTNPYQKTNVNGQQKSQQMQQQQVPTPEKINTANDQVSISAKAKATAKSAALASIVPKSTPSPKQGPSNAEIAYAKLISEKQRIKDQSRMMSSENNTIPSEAIKKATEVYEKNLASSDTILQSSDKPVKRFDPSRRVGFQQSRSKSIGSNLAMKIQMAASQDNDDTNSPKVGLPWANFEHPTPPKNANPGIRKHLASKDKQSAGYKLRMSKSSDSITAAKLLAESRAKEGNNSNLRINKDMSKSIERQIDVYTKTREDIRKILEVAKACSVQERIKLFNNQSPFEEQVPEMSREERAQAIRREILEAKAGGDKSDQSSSSEIQIQSPVEVKVKPLRIPMKPKLVENHEPQSTNNNMNSTISQQPRPEPGSKLRINQPPVPAAPSGGIKSPIEVKSILRTSGSLDRSRRSSAESTSSSLSLAKRNSSVDNKPSTSVNLPPPPTAEMQNFATFPKTEIKPKSILVKKKVPKLVHTPSEVVGDKTEQQSQGPTIYAQSATDISAGEDDDSERQRKTSIPLTINTKARFLEVPQNPERETRTGNQQQTGNSGRTATTGPAGKLRKSKSFASSGSSGNNAMSSTVTGQYEYAMKESEISAKQKTIMAFFDASLTPAGGVSGPAPALAAGNGNNNVIPQRKSMFSPPVGALAQSNLSKVNSNLANNQLQQVKQTTDTTNSSSNLQSAVVKRSSAVAIHAKRGSITSISDEILGDDDLKDVDAVFESLLNSTFQEIQARGRSADSAQLKKKQRSVSVHPTTRVSLGSTSSSGAEFINVGNVSRSTAASAGVTAVSTTAQSVTATAASVADLKSSSMTASSSGPKRGTVNRKQSKHKLVAGEVKSAVIVHNSDPTTVPGNGNMPNKEVLADPLGALPTSHTKKYLPRQQTWAGTGSQPPTSPANQVPNQTTHQIPPISPQTPSPTQSEYDTCPDPWEDY